MAKRRYRKPERLSVTCTSVEFVVQEDRKKGAVIIEYERYDDNGFKRLEVRFRLLSLWGDSATGNAIKAHMVANRNNPTHRSFLNDLRSVGRINAPSQFCFTTDGWLIRYGKPPGEMYHGNDPDSYERFQVFDSKAMAISEIINTISRSRTVGGLNLVSFGKLPDSILIESGFEKVLDVMRFGVPMWKGSPERALGGKGFGSEAAKARQQFLDLVGRAINLETAT